MRDGVGDKLAIGVYAPRRGVSEDETFFDADFEGLASNATTFFSYSRVVYL